MAACVHGMSPLGVCGICTPPTFESSIINDWVLEIARQRHAFIAERLRNLPPGQALCVHDGVGSLGWDVNDEHRYYFATHVIERPEACEWRGRREVHQLRHGLCGNRDDHEPHNVLEGSLAPYHCTADQSTRLPFAAERRRHA